MTFEEKLMSMIIERGLTIPDAGEIIALAKVDERIVSMDNRWTDNIEGYPDTMISLLWMSVKDIAVEWIDANCPKAWFRNLYV